MRPSKLVLFGLLLATFLSFSRGICLAQPTFTTRSTQADGELKSAASQYGEFTLGEKFTNYGAVAGGSRGYEWVYSSKAPGKRGARGAVDGVADSGSAKGNTFTTTVLQDFLRVGQQDTPLEIYKAYLSFNTSAIDFNTMISSMDIIFYGKEMCLDSNDTSFDIHVLKSIYTDPLWNPDWGSTLGSWMGETFTVGGSSNDFKVVDGDPNTGKNVIHIGNPTIANGILTQGGITKIALVSSRTVEGTAPSGQEFVKIYSSDANTPLRPRLEVYYDTNVYAIPVIKPLLTWIPGDPIYNSKGVSSDEVYAGTNTLSFKVRYIYDNGYDQGVGPDPDAGAQLFIDRNNNTEYDADDLMVTMQEVDDTDTDYSDGKDYEATVQIVADGTTNIGYQFLFTTTDDKEAEGIPASKNVITTIQTPASSDSSSSCFISAIFPR